MAIPAGGRGLRETFLWDRCRSDSSAEMHSALERAGGCANAARVRFVLAATDKRRLGFSQSLHGTPRSARPP